MVDISAREPTESEATKQAANPVKLYRLWCGRKRYTHWLADEREIWRIALRNGLAYEDANGNVGLGPLTWIEIGERKYARSKTVPIGSRGRPGGGARTC